MLLPEPKFFSLRTCRKLCDPGNTVSVTEVKARCTTEDCFSAIPSCSILKVQFNKRRHLQLNFGYNYHDNYPRLTPIATPIPSLSPPPPSAFIISNIFQLIKNLSSLFYSPSLTNSKIFRKQHEA